jgi:hypothetical protein
MSRPVRIAALALVAALLDSAAAFGGTGGTDMPWNGPMQAILDNITGSERLSQDCHTARMSLFSSPEQLID